MEAAVFEFHDVSPFASSQHGAERALDQRQNAVARVGFASANNCGDEGALAPRICASPPL